MGMKRNKQPIGIQADDDDRGMVHGESGNKRTKGTKRVCGNATALSCLSLNLSRLLRTREKREDPSGRNKQVTKTG